MLVTKVPMNSQPKTRPILRVSKFVSSIGWANPGLMTSPEVAKDVAHSLRRHGCSPMLRAANIPAQASLSLGRAMPLVGRCARREREQRGWRRHGLGVRRWVT
jgi:hypothetical protein